MIAHRMRALLPARWFGETTPTLNALIQGLAEGWVGQFSMLADVRKQSRLATVSGQWLDIAVKDYLGDRGARRPGQTDHSLREGLTRTLFQPRGTRAALGSALTRLTGRSPIIFEPADATDTGGYGPPAGQRGGVGGGVAYGVAGRWGNLNLPFQVFVTAFRPPGRAVATVGGWGVPAGGYRAGNLEYTNIQLIGGQVGDEAIRNEIVRVIPAGVIIWVRILS